MKLLHVIPHIHDEASGPSYSVPRLCQGLAQINHEVTLFCQGLGAEIEGVSVEGFSEWPMLRRFAISPDHVRAVAQASSQVDIVHNHGLWSMVNVAVGWAVPGKRAKLIVSPRGTLASWALKRRRLVKSYMLPMQKRALRQASLLHATSESEYQSIRGSGFSAPTAIIPNGVDVPYDLGERDDSHARTLLFLSRIHPVKGLNELLRAWRHIQDSFLDWRLVVAGGGEQSHVKDVMDLAKDLDCERVEFPGSLFGNEKHAAYWNAELFILPSHTENFGMVVAEALAHGCPVIVSRGAPWAGIEKEACGWWINQDEGSIAMMLRRALSLPKEELTEMGLKGRAWMKREFSWQAIAIEMAAAYRWVIDGGDKPESIRID